MPIRISNAPLDLPKISFRKVDDDSSTEPCGVHDGQARSYGYNSVNTDFERPEHYIRHIEPIESELATQVEYDMDEQDQEWLDAVNVDRKKEQVDQVSYEIFEILMDRLEKEWFDLMKHVPKPDLALPSEDSTCAICDDGEGENSNAIVFCDGCNLAVHQDCYGVPYIPEGQWLCRKCTVSPENPVSCILCPNEGGAFKQTSTGKWAHLLCAIWIPEVTVGNQVFMEPVENVDKVPKNRWKLVCSLCKHRVGACIQCDNRSCFTAFHVSCARRAKLLMAMKTLPGQDDTPLRALCEKHLPPDAQKNRESIDPEAFSSPDFANSRSLKSSKTARAYSKIYSLGPPLVPVVIVDRLMQYIGKVSVRKKRDFVLSVCKYWSLKREARRGAPLLKRLHLEPWTASSASRQQTDEEKARRLVHLERLRKDLEKVRMLAELARKREKEKYKQAQLLDTTLTTFLFPHEPMLRLAYEQIRTIDRLGTFVNPVSTADAPDYFDVIKNPMYWNKIESKMEKHAYTDVQEFKDDISLIFDNCMLYNKPESAFYKQAARIKTAAGPILARLDEDIKRYKTDSEDSQPSPEDTSGEQKSRIGNLEPPIQLLKLLVQEELITSSTKLLLEQQPLGSLFAFEFEKLKPPPPRPPPRPPRPPRDSKAEKDRAEQNRTARALAARAAVLDLSPGFRGRSDKSKASVPPESEELPQPLDDAKPSRVRLAPPRTRSARALAIAYEAEANIPPPEVQAAAARETEELRRLENERKRKIEDLPNMPLIVEPPDEHAQFRMFNQGWVLPPGTTRRGRVPAQRQFLPSLPKKKVAKSRLSVASTGPSENLTLKEISLADVPALPEEGTTDASAPSASNAEAGPSKPTRLDNFNSQVSGFERSESSELSDLDDIESQRRDANELEENGGEETEEDGDLHEGGTLVWGKVESHPWFPAVVFEEDDDDVPQNVLDQKAKVERSEPGPMHLVRFYDEKTSWAWLLPSKLKLLGEDNTVDAQYLAPYRFKSEKLKQAVRHAYRQAMAEKEI